MQPRQGLESSLQSTSVVTGLPPTGRDRFGDEPASLALAAGAEGGPEGSAVEGTTEVVVVGIMPAPGNDSELEAGAGRFTPATVERVVRDGMAGAMTNVQLSFARAMSGGAPALAGGAAGGGDPVRDPPPPPENQNECKCQ
jgi:hypothetical protein